MAISPKSFYRLKPLRNKIRKYNPISIIKFAIAINNRIYKKSPIEWAGYYPWELMLLIKWTFVFGCMNQTENVCEIEFNRMINLLGELRDIDPNVEDGSKYYIEKTLRTAAYQQFWVYDKLSATTLGRQIEMFKNTNCNVFDFKLKFRELSGIEMQDFFELSFLIFAMSQDGYLINIANIKKLEDIYDKETVASFLNMISLNYESAVKFSKDSHESRSIRDQILAVSAFKRYPLLNLGQGLLIYCPSLLELYLSHFIYDTLKNQYGSDFCTGFGEVFEKYMYKTLDFCQIKYKNEKEIKSILGKDIKVVDALIEINDSTILIEAKAVELNVKAQLNPDSNAMIDSLKTSIIKGVYQGNIVAGKILENKKPNTFYLLIVTYKDIYIGPGNFAWDEFIEQGLKNEFKLNNVYISPNNIFFLSIEDWEFLIKICKNDPPKMLSILLEASSNNQSFNSAKYVFRQHLSKFKNVIEKDPIHFVTDNLDKLHLDIREKWKKVENID